MKNMNKIKIQSICYPEKVMPYNAWCKKFKVGSRVEKGTAKKVYEPGEYDYDKFVKMIKRYDENTKQQNVLQQAGETLLTLCKGQMQKAWNKINIA